MKTYTISKLAADAGVSTNIVRDYERRGLLKPCRCTPGGYRVYDGTALERLRLVLDAKAAGISLATMADLCRAMTNDDPTVLRTVFREIDRALDRQARAITRFRARLDTLRAGEKSNQPAPEDTGDADTHGGHRSYGEAHE